MPGTVKVEFRVLGPVEMSASGRVLSPAEPPAAGGPRRSSWTPGGRCRPRRSSTGSGATGRRHRPGAPCTPTLSRVRGLLDGAGLQLVRGPGGYRLAAAAEQLDLHRFRALAARAQDDAVPPGDRAALLREALALWRGEPLAGLRGDWADGRRRAWSEERTTAVLAWAAAETDAGNAESAVGPLAELTAEQPLAEPVAATLMRVLAAAGRMAQALDEFTRIRRDLRDELGGEPGPALQAAQREVLRGAGPASCALRPGPRPAQLPPAAVPFTGRGSELARLERLRRESPAAWRSPGPPAWARRRWPCAGRTGSRDRFPDGQLYVNLRGYDPDAADDRRRRAGPRSWHALGVPTSDTCRRPRRAAARYRSELAGRRMLIVLDNAAAVEQVRPLLPGTARLRGGGDQPGRLAGLVAVHGARRLDLDLLPAADAHALLRRLVGDRAWTPSRTPTAALADQCARLPLALRVAAELAASRPRLPLADLVAELADSGAAGPARRRRRPAHRRGGGVLLVVRHLRRRRGPAVPAARPAPRPRLRRLRRRRAGRHQPAADARHAGPAGPRPPRRSRGTGRYGMHDLLRAYATGLTADAGTPGRARAAVRLLPGDRGHRHGPAAPGPTKHRRRIRGHHPHPLRERRGLPDGGWTPNGNAWSPSPRIPPRTAGPPTPSGCRPPCTGTSRRPQHRRSSHPRATPTRPPGGPATGAGAPSATRPRPHPPAGMGQWRAPTDPAGAGPVPAGRRPGRGGPRAGNLGRRGEAWRPTGAAAGHYQQALALFRPAGDSAAKPRLDNLGVVRASGWAVTSRPSPTTAGPGSVAGAAGDRTGEACALWTTSARPSGGSAGLPAVPLDHHQEALALFRQLGDQYGEAWALDSLGTVHADLGRRRPGHHTPPAGPDPLPRDRRTRRPSLGAQRPRRSVAAGRPAAALGHHAAALTSPPRPAPATSRPAPTPGSRRPGRPPATSSAPRPPPARLDAPGPLRKPPGARRAGGSGTVVARAGRRDRKPGSITEPGFLATRCALPAPRRDEHRDRVDGADEVLRVQPDRVRVVGEPAAEQVLLELAAEVLAGTAVHASSPTASRPRSPGPRTGGAARS